MKLINLVTTFAASVVVAVGPSARAVEILPPDFVLFEKTGQDYVPEWFQFAFNLPGDGEYLLPKAGPVGDAPVYFLQRISLTLPTRPGIQNYYIPDDVHLFFPVVTFELDNINVDPPRTPAQMTDIVKRFIDNITEVQAVIDGVEVPNLRAHRYLSAPFAVNLPTTNNLLTPIFGQPIEGLIYPVVADGFFLMLAPLSPGAHEVRTRTVAPGPDGFVSERQYILNILARPAYVDYLTGELQERLIQAVPAHDQRPILATLSAARASFQSGRLGPGIRQLEVLQRKVRHHLTPIDAALAAEFDAMVIRILAHAATP